MELLKAILGLLISWFKASVKDQVVTDINREQEAKEEQEIKHEVAVRKEIKHSSDDDLDRRNRELLERVRRTRGNHRSD